MRYRKEMVGWMIASALAVSAFVGCSDSGSNQTTADSGALSTVPSSAESQSAASSSSDEMTSSSSAEQTSPSSSQVAYKIGELAGEGNVAFEQYFGGIIGKRPASGVVTDQKIENSNYDDLKKLASASGHEAFYRIPQINLRSQAAREFNEYIRKRAEIDLESVATYIKNNVKNRQEGDFNGWIYFDYAVIETDRYISIVLFKLNNIWSMNPWVRVEAFVYDKDTSKVLKLTDLLDDFGVSYEEALSGLEALYPRHNIELKIGDSEYTYMNEYSNYLGRVWNEFFSMADDASARGREYHLIEGYELNFYPSYAVYVAHEDGEDRLRVVHRDARITGTNQETGNISYSRGIIDQPFETAISDERRVNKACAALVPEPAEDVLGAIVYLGSEADRELVGKFASLYELDPELGLSVFSMGRKKDAMYVLIPRYEASIIRIEDENDREVASYVTPLGLIFGEEAAPLDIILSSREEWDMLGIPSDYAKLNLSDHRLLDVTDRVQSIEHEKLDDFLEFLRYRFR